MTPYETRAQRHGWSASARIGYFTGPHEPNGCRLWTGFLGVKSYAVVTIKGREIRVSRAILGLTWGDPRFAMHKCDDPRCVEPSHLSIGTNSQNQLDSSAKGRHHHARKTHCAKGHPYDSDNTLWTKKASRPNPVRKCKVCARAQGRSNYWRHKSEVRS